MSLNGSAEPVAGAEDFGLSGHLAAIERMHRAAVAEIEALARPWGSLWSPRVDVVSSETDEQPVTGQSSIGGGRATAA